MRLTSFSFAAVVGTCLLFFMGLPKGWTQQPVLSAPSATLVDSPEPQNHLVAATTGTNTGNVSGTVMDMYGDVVSGATVQLDGDTGGKSMEANDNGFFDFPNLTPGVAYHVTITAKGFDTWTSPAVVLAPGQFYDVSGIKLKLQDTVSSVTVFSSTEQIATEQVQIEEKQRVLGFIPNFYVVYDSKNTVPLTTKLKFQMAYKVATDPVSIVGAAFLAGINQAGNTPNYPQGMKGYGQRFGAAYGDGVTDIMFGGAILPSLLHQDPRYFYQGTGTVKSRMLHALSNPFICRGDNGHREINFSSMGGDLISSAISNTYYPESNRGAGLVFNSFLISTGEREVSSLVQEFVLRKLTPSARRTKLDTGR